MARDEDIRSVRSAEERRGKRPIDTLEKRRAALLRKKFYEVMRSGNESQFHEMLIHELGQEPGSEPYMRSWQAWKEYHGER